MFGFLVPLRSHTLLRQAYARCCSAQQRLFGLTSLPFLSYEGAFLYRSAIEAGDCPAPAENAPACCRLRSNLVRDDAPDAPYVRLSAALGLVLAGVKLDDNVRDDRSLLSWLIRWKLRKARRLAGDIFSALDPKFHPTISRLIAEHLQLEARARSCPLDQYVEPTAEAFGYVFALQAELNANTAEVRRQWLRAVGRRIGAAIVAYDCAVDWPADRLRGRPNPLADQFAVEDALQYAAGQLSEAGWLCSAAFGERSECAAVLRAAFERVCRVAPQHDTNCHVRLERWGLLRQKHAVYANCDGCDAPACDCAIGECFAADAMMCDGMMCCGPHECFGCGCCDRERKTAKAGSAGSSQPTSAVRVGDVGLTRTPLGPSGIVRIGGTRHPAKSDGPWIAAGVPVVVTQITTFGLVVRKKEGEPEA